MRPQTRYAACAVGALATLVVAGCGQPPPAPRETFNWGSQPISFSPPPSGWRREGELSGGLRGVRFIKERSVGEAIGVADYYRLGERDGRARLRELLAKFDRYDRRSFMRALQLVRYRTDEPVSPLEAEVAAAVNAALERASAANLKDDRERAGREVAAALAEADRLRFSLTDVIGVVIFRPERRQEPERYTLLGRRDATIAGQPAVLVDYTFDGPERRYSAREAYVVRNNHLFVATFIGLKENLELFDRVVASIEFPE